MFCSSKSLSIQIYDQYIVCPREGGKVEVSGKYQGYVFCPDYNLICTGTTVCNDMFDCVEKKSLSKENTFDYDYEINTNEEKIYKAEEIPELGEDGICPKNCIECSSDKKCLKCLDEHSFVSENKLGTSFQCIKEEEIDKKKYCYNSEGYYYNCEWKIKEENIDEKLKEDILNGKMDDIIQDYINKNELNDDKLIMYYKDGSKYEGEYVNDKITGYGIFTNKEGRIVYEGYWKNGKREGIGIYHCEDGATYEGEWKDHLKSGVGVYSFSDDSRYMGEFKNDIRDGYGIIYGNNSDKYEGEWKNDQGNGFGIYYYNKGDTYVGFWKNGLRDGFGKLTTQDGVEKIGDWKEGQLEEDNAKDKNCIIF